ncbi:ATP-dependent sacrificial sulfur transferase LarE [Coraliomargarita parva]|uniref:ATP-dependent sacrificial sulfur transferase LarE n=1 Tax=Coraliomargarita parva TaxID=3014050 RepID=UPI0022B5788A|nr:ATP-dependent sacrificial sulfur transferase LarE [Coraliomargarita parva]
MSNSNEVLECIARLERWFARCDGAITAFSGGVDSSLVAFLARHFLGPDRSLAVISASPSLKMSELEAARGFAQANDMPLEVIVSGEIEDPNYFTNPANRCYYCKDALYGELDRMRHKYPDWWVLSGANADDTYDYRPGLEAASEHAVRCPLAECRMSKEMVRAVAAHFKLSCWDKPASPCLASRIPYGQRVTVEKLRQIEKAEAWLKEAGFPINRVRHYGETARVEVPRKELAQLEAILDRMQAALAEIGFEKAEIDREGFVSGKLNQAFANA